MVSIRQMPLRIPEELHRDIQEEAKRRGMSLNQYCLYLLSRHTPTAQEARTQRAEELLQFVSQAQHLQKNLTPSKTKWDTPYFSLKRRLKKDHG